MSEASAWCSIYSECGLFGHRADSWQQLHSVGRTHKASDDLDRAHNNGLAEREAKRRERAASLGLKQKVNGKQYLLMDLDTKFSKSIRRRLSDEGIKPVRLSPGAPNMNAHLERFFGSLKSECLNQRILFGETAARNAVRQYHENYHLVRSHQGLGNELLIPSERSPNMDAKIEATERLRGLLRSISELPEPATFQLKLSDTRKTACVDPHFSQFDVAYSTLRPIATKPRPKSRFLSDYPIRVSQAKLSS